MRISDWSSDVCSSDLIRTIANGSPYIATLLAHHAGMRAIDEEVLEISSAHVAAAIREALRELESRIGRVVLACVARMGSIREERNISLAAGVSLFSAGLFDLEQLCGGPKDRKSVVSGKSVSVRVNLGGRRNIK